MRNIAIITGTRAEFGIWTPILRALQRSKKLRPQLVVTGMHLQREFGYTVKDIERSGIPVAATVPMHRKNDTSADSLVRATAGLAKAFRLLKPELVMLLGDRLEMLAGANAALACNLPMAHLHGGETAPGTWDEQIRHAITKLAHLHFPATKRAAARLRQMGEDPRAIHVVGAPALDAIQAFVEAQPHRLTPRPDLEPILVLLHPSSPEERVEEERTELLISALGEHPFVIIGPNNDPGHKGILRAYAHWQFPLIMSLSQPQFWELLLGSSLLVGNSSAGIIEAASFALPVVNLGDRQRGRERNGNVVDVPWSAGERGIGKAIRFALANKDFRRKVAGRKNLYGDGRAAERVVRVLEGVAFPLATTKRFFDA